MGFSDYHNSVPNPAQRYYRWSGGYKDVTLEDGSTAKVLSPALKYWDGEKMCEQTLPFTFCVLEQTSSVGGYAPGGAGGDVRFYSNEITSLDEPMRITRASNTGSEVVLEGLYQNIKRSLPEGCKYQANLYIYNPEADRVERLNLKGSALSEWITFGQKNKGIYDHPVTMGAGESKTTGSVEYIPPRFTLGTEKYSDDDMKKLSTYDATVVEYLRTRREANLAGVATAEAGIDQTPAHYEGEQSQAAPEGEGGGFNMGDLPF